MSSSLSAGTKLGRYEIRAQIGAGGMGEVYRALDTELDRTVAHPVGHRHHPVSVLPSILRLSAWERLAAVGLVIAALWAAVLWAMS